MFVLIRQLTKRDPTTFVGGFGVWAIVCGIALALPGDIFELNPSWSALQAIHADDTTWGVAMVLDGMALLFSLRLRRVPTRAAISAFSAIMWFLLGSSMVGSAFGYGVLSVIGTYSIYGAIGCIIAVEQWVHYPMGEEHRGDR